MVYLHTGPMGVHRACFFIARAGRAATPERNRSGNQPPILCILPLVAHQLATARDFSRPVATPASQVMDNQLKALPTLPVRARTVSGCMNSAFHDISQHFTSHLFSPWIPSSACGIDGGPRRC